MHIGVSKKNIRGVFKTVPDIYDGALVKNS